MNKAFLKWGMLCAVGAGALTFAALCYMKGEYTWVFAAGFFGLFLANSSWKRIRFLLHAGKAIRAGRGEIEIFYLDKNLKKSQNTVIPAGADAFWFYAYLPEKKDIKAFRWQGIKKALADGRELKKDDVLEYLAGNV